MNNPRGKTRILVPLCGALIFLFLCMPILITLPMSFSDSDTLQFPPSGFSLRWYENFVQSPVWVQAMSTSLQLAAVSSVIALTLGSLAAYGLVRGNLVGSIGLEAHFMAPMIIPNIITAIALYFAFAKLDMLGTFAGLVIAHALVAIPFVITVVTGALRAFDVRIEQSARSLGAKWPRILLSIVIPNIYPALFVAWIFSFVISFDEVILTYFLSGTYVTIPKEMFTQLQEQVDPTITAVSSLLIAGSLLLLLATARLSVRLASENRG
ncbi:ABC transporter permease [Agrobacterium sp. LAD9]|uniref:ABC transporter permease n=1 Tax=Agrobacterium sp. LAD9 TaxID=2055153 RepID=UPI000D1E99DC|nr:ABC transporter permease [Agrobacterium sp. LAD9]